MTGGLRLDDLRRILGRLGCTRLLAKRLAQNDNSKQQVYLGGSFEAVTAIPTTAVTSAATKFGEPRFFAALDFRWVDRAGMSVPAPDAQLILYPQYPEVRLSGFLRGYRGTDADLMRHEEGRSLPERVLFLGIAGRTVHAHVCLLRSALGEDLVPLGELPRLGVFVEIPTDPRGPSKDILVTELLRIHRLGWIAGRRMKADGTVVPHNAQNGAGFTLEAELGVRPSARAGPDFMDWEVKQHRVSRFDRLGAGRITLMTPEPRDGVYAKEGIVEFVRRFGHAGGERGADRMDFTGTHRFGVRAGGTGLTLRLRGYDPDARKMTDSAGGVVLETDRREEAAVWPFESIIEHWNVKHARAAYVPAMHRPKAARREYHFGPVVRLGQGTDALLLLDAIARGLVYYDPGIHVSGLSGSTPKPRHRSQFRIGAGDVGILYRSLVRVDLVTRAETLL